MDHGVSTAWVYRRYKRLRDRNLLTSLKFHVKSSVLVSGCKSSDEQLGFRVSRVRVRVGSRSSVLADRPISPMH